MHDNNDDERTVRADLQGRRVRPGWRPTYATQCRGIYALSAPLVNGYPRQQHNRLIFLAPPLCCTAFRSPSSSSNTSPTHAPVFLCAALRPEQAPPVLLAALTAPILPR
jgi:hypothetical protein